MSAASKSPASGFSNSIVPFIRSDFIKLRDTLTVEAALEAIKKSDVPGEGILYLYVVDDHDRLVGVLPTRRLLTSPNAEFIANISISNVSAITHKATVAHACDMFLKYKYLAFPVVDDEWRLIGRIDVSLFTEEIVDLTERGKADGVFELLGFRMSQVRKASPFTAWKIRFPWLLATICSGTACAFLAGAFEATLAKSLILTFFLTLVLALGESVSIQAMTLTFQRLRFAKPTLRWFLDTAFRDMSAALMLAFSCGIIVSLVVFVLHHSFKGCLVIGASVFASQMVAALMGLTVPSLLHGLKLDPKVAAGPLTLALADLATLSIYFMMGKLFL